MRIVDVNEFYSPTGGGVRTYVDRKMTILADMGHELIVLAPAREDSIEERPGGGKVIWVKAAPMPFDKNYGLFWEPEPVNRWLDELKPDVVENCSPWKPAWMVGDWHGDAAKVFFMHNDNVATYAQRWFQHLAQPERIERAFAWYSRYMNRFLVKYDAVLTNGPSLVKRQTRRGVRVDASMPLGIERHHFSPNLRDERLRAAILEQCGLPPTAHLVLGLGRHHSEKRWENVIRAIESAGTKLPIGFILIGDGVHRRHIEKLVAGSPHIRLFRPVYDRPRLARIMASCDALIHGGESETFGLVASEALASGLPLIVPDEGGCSELYDPLFAERYKARDVKSCADAIRRLFTRDQAILKAAARVAAGKVRTDREHVADLVDHYTTLVAAKRCAGDQTAAARSA